jgi:hypothetical protein
VLFGFNFFNIFFMSRKVDKLVEMVMKPLISPGENAARTKIAEAHKSRLDKYTKLVTALHIGGFFFWILGYSVSIFLGNDDHQRPCTRITIGWISRSRFDHYFIFLNFFWVCIEIFVPLLFIIICIMAIIRIKSQVELLCCDLNSLQYNLKKKHLYAKFNRDQYF